MMWNMLLQEHIHLSCTSKHLRSFTKLPIYYFIVELCLYQFWDQQNKYLYFLSISGLFILILFYDLIVNKPCNLQLSDLEKNYLKKSMTVHKIVSDINTNEEPLLYDSPKFNQLPAELHQTNKIYTEFQLIYYNHEYFQINYKYFLKSKTKTIKYTDLLQFIATIQIKHDNLVTQVLLELSYCKLRNNDTVEKMLEAIQKDEIIERDLGNFFESQDINQWCDEYNKTPSNLMDTFTNQNNFLEKSNTINDNFKLISVSFQEQQVEYEISNTLYKVKVQYMEEKSKQILRQSIDFLTQKLLN